MVGLFKICRVSAFVYIYHKFTVQPWFLQVFNDNNAILD